MSEYRISVIVPAFNAASTIKDCIKSLKEQDFKNYEIIVVDDHSEDDTYEIIKDLCKVVKNYGKKGADSINLNLIRGVPRGNKSNDINIKNYELFNNKVIRNKDLTYSSFRFTDLILAQEIIQKNIIKETYTKNKRIISCYAGNLSSVLYENGDVFPCEILDERLGNVKQYNYNFRNLWNSQKASEIRKKIKNKKCYCTHECNMPVNILFNIRNYPKIFQEIIKIKKQRFSNDTHFLNKQSSS